MNCKKTIKHSLSDENLMLFKFDDFYQKLKAACPVIKHVVWQHGKPDKGFLKVDGYEPECVVNQRHILLEGGELVGKRFFTEYNLAKLPQVTVARKCLKNSDSRKKLQAFVQKLPAHVLAHFDMSYHGDQHIVFEPKKQGAIKQEIVTKQAVSFGDKEQQRIDAIINDMLSKKKYPRRKNSKVVFDFRLDKQVLVKTFDGPRKRRKGK